MTLTIEEFAEQGLEYPQDFSTSAETAFNTHAQVFGTHRDADLLNQSNWSVYCQELPPGKPDEDNVYILGCGHWLVGWYDHLMVRVYATCPGTGSLVRDCTCVECDEDTDFYTPEFRKAYDLYCSMQDYPVLDEEDYSEREYQDVLDTLKSCYNVPEECVNDAYCYLSENHDVCRGDDIRDENVYEWYTAADQDAPEWLTHRYKAGQQ